MKVPGKNLLQSERRRARSPLVPSGQRIRFLTVTTTSMVPSVTQGMGHIHSTSSMNIDCQTCQVETTRSAGVGTAKGLNRCGQIAPTSQLLEVVRVLLLRQLQPQLHLLFRCQCQLLPHLLLTHATLKSLSAQNAAITAHNSRIVRRLVAAGSQQAKEATHHGAIRRVIRRSQFEEISIARKPLVKSLLFF